MIDNNREHYQDAQRQRQIEKYKGEQCVVCGKWGAAKPLFGPMLSNIRMWAAMYRLSVRAPMAHGLHDKCERQVTALARHHESKNDRTP